MRQMRCLVKKARGFNGPMSRVCAWMKPCMIWPSWRPACTASRCLPRMARPFAWLCRGNTVSRASNPSSRLTWWKRCQFRCGWTAAPNEYGFYANVNPNVDHPRWSQSSERRIGELSRRPTLMFNGYEEQVASLYAGMDLAANY